MDLSSAAVIEPKGEKFWLDAQEIGENSSRNLLQAG
jgi:hypothetical protein